MSRWGLVFIIGLGLAGVGGCSKKQPLTVPIVSSDSVPVSNSPGSIDPSWQIYADCDGTYVYQKPDQSFVMWNIDESDQRTGHWMTFASGVNPKEFCQK